MVRPMYYKIRDTERRLAVHVLAALMSDAGAVVSELAAASYKGAAISTAAPTPWVTAGSIARRGKD